MPAALKYGAKRGLHSYRKWSYRWLQATIAPWLAFIVLEGTMHATGEKESLILSSDLKTYSKHQSDKRGPLVCYG